jgi:hypothetical protein
MSQLLSNNAETSSSLHQLNISTATNHFNANNGSQLNHEISQATPNSTDSAHRSRSNSDALRAVQFSSDDSSLLHSAAAAPETCQDSMRKHNLLRSRSLRPFHTLKFSNKFTSPDLTPAASIAAVPLELELDYSLLAVVEPSPTAKNSSLSQHKTTASNVKSPEPIPEIAENGAALQLDDKSGGSRQKLSQRSSASDKTVPIYSNNESPPNTSRLHSLAPSTQKYERDNTEINNDSPSNKISTPSGELAINPRITSGNESVCVHCFARLDALNTHKHKHDTFQSALIDNFPDALPVDEFVFKTKNLLVPFGFYPHVNTMACVGLCRDEITAQFTAEVNRMYGASFNCGSLGGMLFCGDTGFAAAHTHAPREAHLIYYCFTHVAINEEGRIGSVLRIKTGMKEETTACGALMAFTHEIKNGTIDKSLEVSMDDVEQTLLKRHIVKKTNLSIEQSSAPSLLEVTHAAYQTITMDLEKHVMKDSLLHSERVYALFTGIQIHGPNGADFVWSGKASIANAGVISPLSSAAPLRAVGAEDKPKQFHSPAAP